MMDLANRDFKAAIINMCKELKETMFKDWEEGVMNMTRYIEIINKEIMKKNWM